jgi:hypothetical protein
VKTSPNKIANQNIKKEATAGADERGDLLIQRFWTACTDCILDVCVTGANLESHCKRTLLFKVLELQGKEKKQKHLGGCLENCHHFTPFVLSVDGLLGQDALGKTFCSRTCRKVAEALFASSWTCEGKAEHSSSLCQTLCLHGSRVPAHNVSTRFLQWEDGAGFSHA